jgi:hypothetical protein
VSATLSGIPPGPMPPALMGGGAPGGPPGGPPGASPMMAPRPNLGPVSQPSSNPGNTAAALLKIKNALGLLQEALPNIPMGDQLHTLVLDTIKKLAKVAGNVPSQPGLQQQDLLGMMRKLGANPMAAALDRMHPQPGQGPAMPGPPG